MKLILQKKNYSIKYWAPSSLLLQFLHASDKWPYLFYIFIVFCTCFKYLNSHLLCKLLCIISFNHFPFWIIIFVADCWNIKVNLVTLIKNLYKNIDSNNCRLSTTSIKASIIIVIILLHTVTIMNQYLLVVLLLSPYLTHFTNLDQTEMMQKEILNTPPYWWQNRTSITKAKNRPISKQYPFCCLVKEMGMENNLSYQNNKFELIDQHRNLTSTQYSKFPLMQCNALNLHSIHVIGNILTQNSKNIITILIDFM